MGWDRESIQRCAAISYSNADKAFQRLALLFTVDEVITSTRRMNEMTFCYVK